MYVIRHSPNAAKYDVKLTYKRKHVYVPLLEALHCDNRAARVNYTMDNTGKIRAVILPIEHSGFITRGDFMVAVKRLDGRRSIALFLVNTERNAKLVKYSYSRFIGKYYRLTDKGAYNGAICGEKSSMQAGKWIINPVCKMITEVI